MRRASPAGSPWCAAPLCRIARRNSPSARGMASRVPMLIAPADSPKTVTLSGSPPNAAMFVPHPLEGRDLVEQPHVGDAVVEVEEALGAGPPVDHDADDAVASEAAAVVRRRGAELEHAALDPHHHRQPGRLRVGRPEVEVEAVLGRRGALDRRERRRRRRPSPPRPPMAARSASGARPAVAPPRGPWRRGPRPRRHRLRGTEPVRTEGRRRIRHPEEARPRRRQRCRATLR